MSAFVMPAYSKIGIAVNDIDKTIERYAKEFGWSDWYKTDVLDISDTMYKGRISGCKVKSALYPNPMKGQVPGFMTIELVRPIEGESPFKDFLDKHGEGIQHLQIMVEDMEATLSELEARGCKKIFYGRWKIGRESDVAFVEDPLLGVQYQLKKVIQ
jgi:predicted enzyme related to lactoylglutathione lyase